MKSLVLLLFLGLAVTLGQVVKHHFRQWGHPLLPPAQQGVPICQNPPGWPKVHHTTFVIPPSPNNGWRPNQVIDNWISPFFFGFPNYFFPFGYPQQDHSSMPRYPERPPVQMNPQFGQNQGPWPIHPNFGQTQGPWPLQTHLGPQGPWSIHQHFGPVFRQWSMPSHVGPSPGQWPPQPQLAPMHRPWPIPPQVGATHKQWREQPHLSSILRQWSDPHLAPAPGPWPVLPHITSPFISHLPSYYLGDRGHYYVK